MKVENIKSMLKPTIVAQYYLGQPIKSNNLGLWYKSPFRNEKTASFLVSDRKGIHDFGTSIHYDIISFTENLFKIDFKTAIDKLYYDFHIIDSEATSKELEVYLNKKNSEEIEIKNRIDGWFLNEYFKLCDKLIYTRKIKRYLQDVDSEMLKIINMWEIYLECMTEEYLDADDEYKIKLWREKHNGIDK